MILNQINLINMERELKFRAWNGKVLYQMKALLLDENKYKQLKESNAVIMQYTGLKDKNGKDVYEGDVLRYKSKYTEYYTHVYFENGSFCDSDTYPANCYGVPFSEDSCINFEVIGNIYENPELLNQMK